MVCKHLIQYSHADVFAMTVDQTDRHLGGGAPLAIKARAKSSQSADPFCMQLTVIVYNIPITRKKVKAFTFASHF